METKLIVTAIIENNGKLLFGKKHDNVGPYPNTWHILGGAVKEKESIKDAVKREIKEEAGIQITDIEPISFGDDIEANKHGIDTYYIFLYFKAKYKSGKLKAGSDIKELRWIDKAALPINELNRPTKKIFKKLNLL